jgi:hypothetical protein
MQKPGGCANTSARKPEKRRPLQTASGMQEHRLLTEPDVLRLMMGNTTGAYVAPAIWPREPKSWIVDPGLSMIVECLSRTQRIINAANRGGGMGWAAVRFIR